MRKEKCMGCRYCHKKWNEKRVGGYIIETDSYYACHFLPYWGKHVETIEECPKKNLPNQINPDGSEDEWTLRNAVRVNS